jgi:SAM-dependent methyltransferase
MRVGLDISSAQLTQAKRANPDALFVNGDLRKLPFVPHSFDLVTNFWAAYCYLDSTMRIATFLQQCIELIRPGGALYFEILLAEDLASFNVSKYAQATGFRVSPRSEDYSRWRYEDNGGVHDMTSPPLGFFTMALDGRFRSIDVKHDGRFMVHLLATGKCA